MHDELLQHQAFLERLARRLVTDEAAAQDLVQDTWLRAIARPPREQGSLRSWLGTVVRRLARERARGGRRRLDRERGAARPEATEDELAGVDLRLDFQALLIERLRALPEAQRIALALRYVEDLPPPAIAQRLGVPLETVKARLRRGLATLREELDRKTGGDRAAWAAALLPELGRGATVAAAGGGGSAALAGGGIMMTTGTKGALAALAAAALVGGWWILRAEEEASAPSTREQLAALEHEVEPRSEGRSAGAPIEQANATAATREALDTPSAEQPAPGAAPEGVRTVRVVESASGAPLPGAEVLWLHLGQADTEARRRARSVTSVDGLLEERGELTLADDRGMARISHGAGELVIVGRSPGLWGWGAQPGDAPGELRLELLPDASIDVEVVDRRGAPVAGIPVALRRRMITEDVRSDPTDEHGRARLLHVLVPPFHRRALPPLVVGIAAPLYELVEQELDSEALPREPVRLVLPPTGSLEVLARDLDGRALSSGWVQVQVMSPYRSRVMAAQRIERGRALFEHVGPGLELRLSVRGEGAHMETILICAGPESAGQRRTVEVVQGSDHPVLRLRALDERGAPLGGALLHTWTGSPGGLASGLFNDVTTDEEGHFDLHYVPPILQSGNPRLLRVRQAPGPGTPARQAERGFPGRLEPGLHELGDLVLAPAPLVAAGIVLGPRGEPLAGARVLALLLDVDGTWRDSSFGFPPDSGAQWRWSGLEAQSSADGSFALHGSVPPGRISVTASFEGLASDSVECPRGAGDLRLSLSGTATLLGRVETDAATSPERLYVRAQLESSGGIAAADLGVQDGWPANAKRAETFVRPDGSFAIAELKPGRWALSAGIRVRARRSALRSVGGIEALAGEATLDPRLDPLDLRGVARTVRVELVTPALDPPPSGYWGWRDTGTGQRKDRMHAAGNELELILLAAPLDVDLEFHGYRPVRLEGVTEDQRVELVPALSVRLRLPAELRLPESPYRLAARLASAEAPPSLGGSTRKHYFDTRGELRWMVGGPGTERVQIALERVPERMGEFRDFGSSVEAGRVHRIEVIESAEEQLFVLDLTQAELDAALAAISD